MVEETCRLMPERAQGEGKEPTGGGESVNKRKGQKIPKEVEKSREGNRGRPLLNVLTWAKKTGNSTERKKPSKRGEKVGVR